MADGSSREQWSCYLGKHLLSAIVASSPRSCVPSLMTMVRCLFPFMVRTFGFRKTLLHSEALQLAFVRGLSGSCRAQCAGGCKRKSGC